MPRSRPSDLYFLPAKDHGIELLASEREIQKQKVSVCVCVYVCLCICVCVNVRQRTPSFKNCVCVYVHEAKNNLFQKLCVCVCVYEHEAKNTLSFKNQLEKQNSHRRIALNIIPDRGTQAVCAWPSLELSF